MRWQVSKISVNYMKLSKYEFHYNVNRQNSLIIYIRENSAFKKCVFFFKYFHQKLE